MTETPEQLPAEGEDKDKEHPHGGPPGQTGENPGQSGAEPPGQAKKDDEEPGPQPPEPTQLPAEGGEDEEGTEAKP